MKTETPKTTNATVPQSQACPYTIAQVLANLRNCAEQLEAWPESPDAGPGYVLGILNSIVSRGIHETAKVEVLGGVAELTQCPAHVTVTIQDHDNEATGH